MYTYMQVLETQVFDFPEESSEDVHFQILSDLYPGLLIIDLLKRLTGNDGMTHIMRRSLRTVFSYDTDQTKREN